MTYSNKYHSTIISFIFAITCTSMTVNEAMAAKGGGGKGGGNAGGGGDTPVYTASGDLINATTIDSTNLSFNDIIFRPSANFTFDLSAFPVSDPGGGSCPGFSDETTGTLVLASGDSAVPNSAELRFGFQGQLSSNGKSVQHFLVMQGTLDGDWAPTSTTYLTFTGWEISAENKKSQKSDCEGAGEYAPVLIDIWPATP